MLNQTADGINYYIHMKDFVAELLQRRPWTQAARQALPDNGAWG
jgi:hypothetical protein